MEHFDLLIIGGGASGLAAAVTAKSLGIEKVVVLEQLPRVGVKLRATGGGKCNISHVGITAADYRGSVDTAPILEEFGDARTFFENLGLYLRQSPRGGLLYPYTMRAESVVDAFRLNMAQTGVEERCMASVYDLFFRDGLWHVKTQNQFKFSRRADDVLLYPTSHPDLFCEMTASNVIFSTGGYSSFNYGTDGKAWALLKQLNIPIVPPVPNLCPVLTDEKLVQPLKGFRIMGEVTLYDGDTAVRTEAGEVQFTDRALSGICVFNLSGYIDPSRFSDYHLSFDPLPEFRTELTDILYALQGTRYTAKCEDVLSGILPKPLARLVLKNRGIRPDESSFVLTNMSHRELRLLADEMQSLRFPVRGLGSFDQAQSTRGGVPGSALDTHLQVKAHPGLYITGEAADVHAHCGGYHLHWAWASGYAAAADIARRGGKL